MSRYVASSLSEYAGGELPARNLQVAARATNPGGPPLNPADDAALIVELDGVRGHSFIARTAREIRNAGAAQTLRFLSGHTGAGKSTEMARLAAELGRVTHTRAGNAVQTRTPKAQVIAFNAQPLIDQISDLDLDLLVGLWQAVVDQRKDLSLRLLGNLWNARVYSILKKVVTNLPDTLVAGLQRVVGSLRGSEEERKHTRAVLSSVADALIDGLNDVFEQLRDDPTSAVVVLIDNLKKLSERSRDVVEHLYLNRLGTLKKLDAHLVISAPAFLLLDPRGAGLTAAYGAVTVFVPMVKLRVCAAEGGSPYEPGLAKMAEILTRRVDFEALFERGAAAAREVAIASGGRLRDALMLTHSALNSVDEPKVPWSAVQAVIGEEVQNRARGLPETWGKTLRHVGETNRFPPTCSPQDRADMLRGGYVLEYQNGDPAPFYVVHPLVERTAVFQHPAP